MIAINDDRECDLMLSGLNLMEKTNDTLYELSRYLKENRDVSIKSDKVSIADFEDMYDELKREIAALRHELINTMECKDSLLTNRLNMLEANMRENERLIQKLESYHECNEKEYRYYGG